MNQQQRIFITGTDTDAGKTVATCALIRCIQNVQKTVMAVKPVAAGCENIDGELKNSDALQMQQHLEITMDYSQINPVALKAAIAPHIAADEEGVCLTVEALSLECQLSRFETDIILIEGAGGWLVPLNSTQSYADFVVEENLSVILVVGMKLGCINHALLTVESIKSRGLNLIGWIANTVENEMERYQQNVDFLKNAIEAPLLGMIPHIKPQQSLPEEQRSAEIVQTASSYVNIAPLLKFISK